MGGSPWLQIPHGDPVAVAVTSAIRSGDLDTVRRLLSERPELTSARMIGRKGAAGGWRTVLHVATDWPGFFPAAPDTIRVLLAAGADPNIDSGGDRPETPLHWAASSDDAASAAALIDGGAELETPGGSIGTPLDNAVGYCCWHVARLLVARGATVDRLWHAGALGMQERLAQLVDAAELDADAVSQAFWHACSGGQRRAAEYLLDLGADLNWVPDYAAGTPLDAAATRGTQRENVVTWLHERGARSAAAEE